VINEYSNIDLKNNKEKKNVLSLPQPYFSPYSTSVELGNDDGNRKGGRKFGFMIYDL
jgi:hypothetical protein